MKKHLSDPVCRHCTGPRPEPPVRKKKALKKRERRDTEFVCCFVFAIIT